MDEENGEENLPGNDAMTDDWKVKAEASGVVVKAEPRDQLETDDGKVTTEDKNEELVSLPSTSSDFKYLAILKKKMKRRYSEEEPFKIISETISAELDANIKPVALFAIHKKRIF